EVTTSRTTVLAQQSEIAALRAAYRTRQAQLVETLRLVSSLQTQVTALQGHQGPARGPAQPDIPEEAGGTSSIVACGSVRSMNGDDNHNSGTGVRRTEHVARECTYQDFMK
ncbi:hypothetical protein Tco_0518462, partial [Tanacetum coccineum]